MDRPTTRSISAPKLVLEPVRDRAKLVPHPLATGRFLIGSGADCDIVIPIAGVAEQHCLMIVGANKTIVKALSPLTWINDGPLTEAVLRHGERLILGPVELRTRRPELSEWIDAPETPPAPTSLPAPPPASPISIEHSQIAALLDHAQQQLQTALQEPALEPTWSEDMPLAEAVERHADSVQVAESIHSQPIDTPSRVDGLSSRFQEINERELQLQQLQTQLAEDQARLAELSEQLDRQRIALEAKQTNVLRQLEEQAQQAEVLTSEEQRVEQLATMLEEKLREVERQAEIQAHRADQLSQRDTELSLREESLREQSVAIQAAAALPAVSTISAEVESELERRNEALNRREALLSSSMAALQTSRDQIARESAQLEERFASLLDREQNLRQHTKKLAEDSQRVENESRTCAERLADIEQREQALEQSNHELGQRESAVATSRDLLESRERELKATLTEIDIREEALNQQFCQLHLDRSSLRNSQSRLQLLEQESQQRIADLESSIEARSKQLDRELEEQRRKIEEQLGNEWQQKSQALAEQATEHAHRENSLNERQQQLAELSQQLEEQNQGLEASRSELESLRATLESQTADLNAARIQVDQDRESVSQDIAALQELRAENSIAERNLESRALVSESDPSVIAREEEIAAIREQLEAERLALAQGWKSIEEAQQRLQEERQAQLTEQADLAAQAVAGLAASEDVDALRAERESLAAQLIELESERQALRAERNESAQMKARLESDHEQLLALKRESEAERDVYLLERQELITERHTIKDRERDVEKRESQIALLRTEAEKGQEEIAFAQRQLDQQKRNLEIEWNVLREDRAEYDKAQLELEASRAELTQLAHQLTELRESTALEGLALADADHSPTGNMQSWDINSSDEDSNDSEHASTEPGDSEPLPQPAPQSLETNAFRAPSESEDELSEDEQEEVEIGEANLADDEEPFNDEPDPLAGFANFSSIGASKDEMLPPEIAEIIRRAGGHAPAADPNDARSSQTTPITEPQRSAETSLSDTGKPKPAPRSSGTEEQRLRDLLGRSSESFVDAVLASTRKEHALPSQGESPDDSPEEDWQHSASARIDTDIVHELSSDVIVSQDEEDAADDEFPRMEAASNHSSEDDQPQDDNSLALRSRLSEMFGINLAQLRQPGSTTERDDIPDDVDIDQQNEYQADYAENNTTASATSPGMGYYSPDSLSSSEDQDAPIEDEESREPLDPVAAYMEQLLARTRRSKESSPPPPPPPPPPAAVVPNLAPEPLETEEIVQEEEPDVEEEVAAPLKKRDGEIAAKEQIRANLDSFRSIANNRARSDVARSEFRRLILTVKVKQIFLMLSGGIALILLSTEVWSSTKYRMETLAALTATGLLSFDFIRTRKRMKELSALAPVELDAPASDDLPESNDE